MLRVPRLGGAGQVVLPPRGNPARPPFLTRREKELVLSDHFDTRSAHTFQGKCFVHTLTEYKKLSMARLKDFFCRFEYKVASASITPGRVTVYGNLSHFLWIVYFGTVRACFCLII